VVASNVVSHTFLISRIRGRPALGPEQRGGSSPAPPEPQGALWALHPQEQPQESTAGQHPGAAAAVAELPVPVVSSLL